MHHQLIKSKILSFEPLSTRGSPVTQKLSQEWKMLRTWDLTPVIIILGQHAWVNMHTLKEGVFFTQCGELINVGFFVHKNTHNCITSHKPIGLKNALLNLSQVFTEGMLMIFLFYSSQPIISKNFVTTLILVTHICPFI